MVGNYDVLKDYTPRFGVYTHALELYNKLRETRRSSVKYIILRLNHVNKS